MPTGYVFVLVLASLAALVLCCGAIKLFFCRTPVRYGSVGSDDAGFEKLVDKVGRRLKRRLRRISKSRRE